MEQTKAVGIPAALKVLNYLLWSRLVKTALGGRGLWSHVTDGQVPKQVTQSEDGREIVTVNEEKWSQEDSWCSELEMLRPSTTYPTALSERREQDKVFGLFFTCNSCYNDLIKHILRAGKLPSLDDLNMAHKVEVVVANKGFYKQDDKKVWVYDHCKKKKGHMKDKCWIHHPQLKHAKFKEPRSQYNMDARALFSTDTPGSSTSSMCSTMRSTLASNKAGDAKDMTSSALST
ncbi:hypothetical protein N665_0048s0007 [Sinapis alba]|nr:hypothetical protein N665_0048s0007 [Sinapis alba]